MKTWERRHTWLRAISKEILQFPNRCPVEGVHDVKSIQRERATPHEQAFLVVCRHFHFVKIRSDKVTIPLQPLDKEFMQRGIAGHIDEIALTTCLHIDAHHG